MNDIPNDTTSVHSNQSLNNFDFKTRTKQLIIGNNNNSNNKENIYNVINLGKHGDTGPQDNQSLCSYDLNEDFKKPTNNKMDKLIQQQIQKPGRMSMFEQVPPSRINQMREGIESCPLHDFDRLPAT